MALPLTDRQRDVHRFVVGYAKAYGFPPTLREIGEAIGGKGRPETGAGNARQHLSLMEKKGYVGVAPKLSRGITVLLDEDGNATASVPVVDVIPRGECWDCGAALFGVSACPMCAQGISRRSA